MQIGHSQYFFKVSIKTKKNLQHELHDVLIVENINNQLFGKLI